MSNAILDLDPENPKQGFTGIFIPKAIWNDPDLSLAAKCLWAQIDSLYQEEAGGCFASNAYLQKFLHLGERQVQERLNELKAKGLLEMVGFNGRTRIMRALGPTYKARHSADGGPEVQVAKDEEDVKNCGADPRKTAGQTCGKLRGRPAENCGYKYIVYNQSIKSERNTAAEAAQLASATPPRAAAALPAASLASLAPPLSLFDTACHEDRGQPSACEDHLMVSPTQNGDACENAQKPTVNDVTSPNAQIPSERKTRAKKAISARSMPIADSEPKVARALHVETTEKQHATLVSLYGDVLTLAAYAHLSEWRESKIDAGLAREAFRHGDFGSIKSWVIGAVKEKEAKETAERLKTKPGYQRKGYGNEHHIPEDQIHRAPTDEEYLAACAKNEALRAEKKAAKNPPV